MQENNFYLEHPYANCADFSMVGFSFCFSLLVMLVLTNEVWNFVSLDSIKEAPSGPSLDYIMHA